MVVVAVVNVVDLLEDLVDLTVESMEMVERMEMEVVLEKEAYLVGVVDLYTVTMAVEDSLEDMAHEAMEGMMVVEGDVVVWVEMEDQRCNPCSRILEHTVHTASLSLRHHSRHQAIKYTSRRMYGQDAQEKKELVVTRGTQF